MSSAVLAGRFQIAEHAGKGASGDVYRALDLHTRRSVAIKVLTARQDESANERFSREIQLLGAIDDPHVVKLVASGVDELGRPYLAVEWLEGEDLARRQQRAPLDGHEALEVVRQSAMGLAALHAHGIVHRDIKPSNIFLSWTTRGALHVTLIDLGVARTETSTTITREGMMVGTPSYMSPEQVLGRAGLTAASDLFSLGVVLFELIARERPYRADDVFGLVAKIGLQEPPRVSSIAPGVPDELDTLVATAMAKEPGQRFATAIDLARALEVAPPYALSEARADAEDEPTKTTAPLSIASTERRVVTTVFVRIASTMGASAAWAPFDRIARAAGGAPYKLLSLAFVAVFGEARSTGDEAHRAARAALAIRAELPYSLIAIATGRSIAGASGLAADAIDRGVRLIEAGQGGAPVAPSARIYVDGATARLLGDSFEITEDGGSCLVGEHSESAPRRTFLGRVTPCVGRDRELSQLESIYDEVARESVARAAIVIGEAGGGKSRVRHELQHRMERHPACPWFLVARGSALGAGSPFGMIGSAMRSFARIQENEPIAVQREKLAATVRDAARSPILPLLSRLASVDGAPSRGAEDGALVSDQLRGAFEAWLRELAFDRPVCIILEDAHHGDAPSIRLVDGALGNLSDQPLFVIALGRPELDQRFPRLWQARDPTLLSLGKLSRRASVELAGSILGARAASAFVDGLVDRAGGNAFFLEELIRAAVTSSDDAPGTVSDLPDTVLGMVQARLDALGGGSKRVLKAASLFGEAFWPSAVASVLGDSTMEIEGAFRELVSKEVLERRSLSRFHDQEELTFRHAIVRDASYELLTDDDRKTGHGRAAEWLEANGEREAAVLARHFERAGQSARAMVHFERAAEQALVGSDFEGAIENAERALAYGATGSARGRLLLTVAEARRWRGELAMSLEAAAYAEEGLEPGSVEWFGAVREQVAAHGRLGHKDRIGTLADRALDQVAMKGAEGAQIAALVPAAVHLLYVGDRRTAATVATRTETITSRILGLEPRARARVHQLRGALAQSRDEHEIAIREQEAALQQFAAANDRRASALVSSNLGFALLQLGALERAEEVLRNALVLSHTLGLGTIIPLAKQNLGAVLARLGRLEEARHVQLQAVETFAALRDPRLEGTSRIHLALLDLACGEIARAEETIAPVLESKFESLIVGAHAALSIVHLRRGDAQGSLKSARAAAELLEQLGAVEEFDTLARVMLVEATTACGQYKEAAEAARAARARIDERADRIDDPDMRRSFLERTPEIVRLAELEARLTGY